MKFFKGLHIDNHPADQPEGTYRDARNIVINEQRGAVANEPGNESTSLFPFGYLPIGRVTLPDDRVVVFLATEGGGSEIGIIQKNGKYETLANDPRLNFSLEHPIDAVARLAPQRFLSQQFSTPNEVEFTESDMLVGDETQVTIS